VRRRPLHLQLYLALLASILVCLGLVAVAFRFLREPPPAPVERLRRAGEVLAETRPDVRAPDARQRLDELADELNVDILVGDTSGLSLASTSPRPFAPPRRLQPGWRQGPQGVMLVVDLGDDRWAAVRARGTFRPPRRVHPFFATLIALAVLMSLASYPVARRVTRKLQALTAGVERWGRGELTHRVAEEGADEVATLAATFNRAAERLDLLLDQQRQMLANASHELRSPLTRLRMGLELIAEEPDPARRQARVEQIRRDIVELDALIEEVLLYARADARVPRRPPQPVDLGALVREEAGRIGAAVEVDAAPGIALAGDAVMLRHLVRNLLENAERHGAGRGVRASVRRDPDRLVVAIEDQGPGVPEEDRERIFAPFYRRARGASHGAAPPPGHGLGLALVRQVARYHGGEVTYHARVEGGSRFEVALPA
jgi:signal transduction histidine kinase